MQASSCFCCRLLSPFLKYLPSVPLPWRGPPPTAAHLTPTTAAQLLLCPCLLPALGTPSNQSANLRVGRDLGLYPFLMHKHSLHGDQRAQSVSSNTSRVRPLIAPRACRWSQAPQRASGIRPRPLLQAVPLHISCGLGGPQGPAHTLHLNLHAFPRCSLHGGAGATSLVHQRIAPLILQAPANYRLCEAFCDTRPDSTK